LSHVVSIKMKIHDSAAVSAACERLCLPAPVQGNAKLYSGTASGLLVQLPGWRYPAVIDTQSGTVKFDNFSGRWGTQDRLDKFLQMYSVEKAKIEARKGGYTVTEQSLEDGGIKLQILERAA
jgi:hypothetical protein